LLQDTKIVVLDEVTSAMDSETEGRVRRVLRERLKGRTVLMVAHREAMWGMCDVVVEVQEGRVVGVERRGEEGFSGREGG
jgi:ABC-type multidrug transport system fused ATPase/permease subunit